MPAGPILARKDDQDRRFYTFGNPPESYWSVTTLINGGVPKYLAPHYAKMAAELAFEAMTEKGPHSRAGAIVKRLAERGRVHVAERQARGELKSIKLARESQRDLALRWIKGAADRHRDAAAQRGTDAHGEAEQLVLTHARESARLTLEGADVKPWPDELRGYEQGFVRFVREIRPTFLAAEATVFNRDQAYAGTLDAIITLPAGELLALIQAAGHVASSEHEASVWAWLSSVDGAAPVTVIVDMKTGNAVYAEVSLQLAAYAAASFIGAADGVTELPLPEVHLGAVLHIRRDGTYQLRLVRIDEPILDAFKFAREVFRFVNVTSRTVLLQDVTPPMPAEEVA